MDNNIVTLKDTNIEDLIESEAIQYARTKSTKDFSAYKYNGVSVPRVTSIIDSSMNKDGIIEWALSFDNKYAYRNEKDFILAVGTKTHDAIEEFLSTGQDPDLELKYAPRQGPIVRRAYKNFKLWYNNLINSGNTFELIGLEVPVINPFYGGSLDCIARINGACYILDFKTSSKISYDYIMQVCAYMWTINNGYTSLPHVNGIGIIRVDKKVDGLYNDLFLNEFIPEQNKIINDFIRGFGSMLAVYYEKISMNYQFNKYKKEYNGIENIISITS